jgi:hypothetical protein
MICLDLGYGQYLMKKRVNRFVKRKFIFLQNLLNR